jgi:phage shock protein A
MATVHALDPKSKGTKLSAKLARDLADADAEYAQAKQKLDEIAERRAELYDKARPKLASGQPQTAGGVLVKWTSYDYETFSLKDYKAAGHKVTAQMRRHVKAQQGEKWTIKRVGS